MEILQRALNGTSARNDHLTPALSVASSNDDQMTQ